MTPATLDLFILTFNCAKNLINVSVFASHLYAALSRNATGLPDLVVLSLQEVAPLSYSFIGSYFLNPYYARFGDALNLASARLLATADGDDGYPSFSEPHAAAGSRPTTQPYTLVRAKNVGMTAILLYARDPDAVRKIEEAECGFGAADMGNKGAVGLRVTWSGPGRGQQQQPQTDATGDSVELDKTTELTFVATHLAAMEWNLKKRNSNWRSIVSSLTFANPRSVLPGVFPAKRSAPTPDRSGAGDTTPPAGRPSTGPTPDSSEAEEEEVQDTEPLLHEAEDLTADLSPSHLAALQDISIFKPTAHLFVAGDLNYRISSSPPAPLAAFPSFDPSSENYFPAFLPRDQLTRERLAGRTLHGLTESPVTFGPTYKFDVLAGPAGAANEAAVRAGELVDGVPQVPWRFAPHRWPGWCDRVLYLDLPEWVVVAAATTDDDDKKKKKKGPGGMGGIHVLAYDAMPVLATSDHRPVYWHARVPLLGADEMRPPPPPSSSLPPLLPTTLSDEGEEEQAAAREMLRDPRVRMPVPVDVHAWERRAAARRREVVVGWSALLFSTREGAVVLATALALGVGSWWLWRGW
ncbi:hypothetical protein VTK56DRAFT_2641 [Thermocarpiscus australiensis]